MTAKREKVHFESVEELLGAPVAKDATSEIRIDQIFPFENHPFKVLDDDRMQELVESIRQHGVLVPVLVRPDDEGTYEMISGHRRMHAAKLAGLTTIPAIIKPMTDDEATIAMVDANMQREEILPSERAFSLKMKMDAMRVQERISGELEAEKIGKELKVIVDRREGDYYIARSEYSSPEVDPEVLIEAHDGMELEIGGFYIVEITGSEEFDVYATVLGRA